MTADDTRTAQWRFAVAIAGIVAVTFWTYRDVLSYWFTGVDALPLILSSRLGSIFEIPSLFVREHLAAFSGEEIAGAVGVRPVATLTFATDYWIWGLNPFGYHLTNVLLHCTNAVLVFVLAQHLKVRQPMFVGICAALLFAVHPIQARTVTVIPVRFDLLLCTFVMLSFIMALRYVASNRRRSLVLCLVFGALALGTKEAALVAFPVILATAVILLGDDARPLRRLSQIAVGFGSLIGGYSIYRTWVVKGIGGYPLKKVDSLHSLAVVTGRFFGLLLHPTPFGRFGQFPGTLLIGSMAAGLMLIVLLGSLRYLVGFRTSWFAVAEARLGADAPAAVAMSLGLVAFFVFFLAIHKATGIFQHWYMYLPSAMYSIVAAIAIAAAGSYFWRAATSAGTSRRVLARHLAVVALAVALPATSLGRSPLFGYLGDWSAGSRLAKAYLESVGASAQTLPQGAVVFLLNLPHGLNCGHPPCVAYTTIFEDYSVASWMILTHPDRKLTFVAASTIWLDDNAERVDPRTSYDPARREMTVQNTGGCVELPWQTRSGQYFTTEMDGPDCKTTSRLKLIAELPETNGYYFFDYFDPGRVQAISGTELVSLEHLK